MATISSVGIGSGLDVNSIITKLVDLEKQPITTLKTKATALSAQLSAYGTIKSQVSALNDAALSLGTSALWNPISVTSSNTSAVTASATGVPSQGSYSIEVQQLSRGQSVASSAVASGASLGTGTLSIQLGKWSSGFGAFTPGAAAAVSVTIGAGQDSLASIASKINDSGAGVTATIITDNAGQRLSLRSNTTGELSGFRMQVTDADTTNNDNAGLSRLAFDPATNDPLTSLPSGMATTTASSVQARDAQATLNGVAVTSSTNTFASLVPGLSLQVGQVTTAPVTVGIAQDTASIKKTITSFVDAYNALNTTLTDATTYDSTNKVGSLLQGDSTTVGLQNALRNLVGSITTGGTFSRLSDIGITVQRDGSLLAGTKLDTALQNMPAVKSFFTSSGGTATTNGLGLKLKTFTQALLATGGTIGAKSTAIQTTLNRNSTEQQKVTDRAATVETRLRKQYSALDSQMASLTALNNYVTQQVTLWNKSTA